MKNTVSNLNVHKQSWQMHANKSLSANSFKQYNYLVCQFISYCNEKSNDNDINSNLMRWLFDKPIIMRSKAIAAIKHFWGFLEFEFPPFIKSPKLTRKIPKTTDSDQTIAILHALKQHRNYWIGVRNFTIGLMLYCCGLRISECLDLTNSAIQQALEGDFLVIKGKGSKFRHVPMLPCLKSALKCYLDIRPDKSSKFVFISSNGNKLCPRDIQRYLKPLGISPHTLRHNFATDMINNGASISTIKKLLGHTSSVSTAHYTKVGFDAIRQAMQGVLKYP